MKKIVFFCMTLFLSFSSLAYDDLDLIGEVSTEFKLFGPDHKIQLVSFSDPQISGVSCYLGLPVSGGLSGAIGLAEDKSDVSITCSKNGETLVIPDDIQKQTIVMEKSRSALFKSLKIVRFHDEKQRNLIYLTYSTKTFEGSPKNSISVIHY